MANKFMKDSIDQVKVENQLPDEKLRHVVGGVVMCGGAGLLMDKLVFSMPLNAWLCAAGVAILAAVVGGVLFQRGVREIGGANSALLSLFEPITSVVFSVLLLGDVLSVSKVLGSLLIMGSLVLITLNSKE